MDTVQKIKEKLSIIDVVTPYVKLTKAGRTLRGLSPFNKEKTPSFFVNPERGTYYCFSSSQGGDHFEFIQKMEGVDFKGAVKILAEKAGVEIEYSSPQNRQDKDKLERLREAMAAAERFFSKNLAEQAEGARSHLAQNEQGGTLLKDGTAYEYALSRGMTADNIRAWNLGYAPDGWRNLLESLTAEGFKIEELLAAGLVKEADEKRGTFYDRFRNRLMFPIRDSAGRTVAFTGRALAKDDLAKYLNSPETELYKKHAVLFGMDKAKDAIRQRGFALLVEGQFDLVLLHQIGFTNTIALSGTALSTEHLSLIKRYAENLMLALDADRAGLAASAKNAQAALRAGMRVKAVRLPQGKDPADLASEDPKDFAKRVQESETIVEFFLAVLSSAESNLHRLVMAVERIVMPLIGVMTSPMEREHFVSIVARVLASTPEAVRASIPKSVVAPRDEDPIPAQNGKPAVIPGSTDAKKTMMQAIILAYPDSPLAKRVQSEYARIIGTQDGEAIPERAIFEAVHLFGETPSESAADDLIRSLEQATLAKRLAEATFRLRQAESSRNELAIQEAMQECKEISKEFARLGQV